MDFWENRHPLSCNGLKTVGFSENFQCLILNLGRCTIVIHAVFCIYEYPCETRLPGSLEDPILIHRPIPLPKMFKSILVIMLHSCNTLTAIFVIYKCSNKLFWKSCCNHVMCTLTAIVIIYNKGPPGGHCLYSARLWWVSTHIACMYSLQHPSKHSLQHSPHDNLGFTNPHTHMQAKTLVCYIIRFPH